MPTITTINIIIFATSAFFCSWILTKFACLVALKYGIVDKPTQSRKIHKKPIPLLGGSAILITFFVVIAVVNYYFPVLSNIPEKRLFAVLIASLIILIIGILDDIKEISAIAQLIPTILAIVITVLGGMGLQYLTNPLGGFFDISEFAFFGISIANAVVFVWLFIMTHTTKLLDGLDGLVCGVVGIGAMIIAIFSLFTKYYQPDIALISAVLCGACFGFLMLNKHPAKIFLGSVGSLWLGYILGVLAIVSGGKLAIALLVLGAPIIDMIVVIIRRMLKGEMPWIGDASHLHFQLMKSGFGHKKTVYIYWSLAVGFGGLTVFLQSSGKLIAFLLLSCFTFFTIFLLSKKR